MPNPSPALAEPLFQEVIPSRGQCNGKVLTLLSLLVGSGFVTLLSSVLYTPGGDQKGVAVQNNPITMAGQYMQPAKMQLVKSMQSSRPMQFMQPAGVWNSMPPSRAREFMRPPFDGQSTLLSRARQIMQQASSEAQPVQDVADAQQQKEGADSQQAEDEDREKGLIQHWIISKGYGFIQPADGSEPIFCHISSIFHDHTRGVGFYPHAGDVVTYSKKYDEKKKAYKAELVEVSLAEGERRGHFGEEDDEMLAAPMGELTGTVSSWNGKKGFGFITSSDGGDQIFVHFSQLVGSERLMEGDPVTYNTQVNDRSGKVEAIDVRFEQKKPR